MPKKHGIKIAMKGIIKRLEEELKINTDIELAEFLGLTDSSTITNWKSRGSGGLELILSKCEKTNIDFNYVFKGIKQNPIDSDKLPFQLFSKVEAIENKLDRLEKNDEMFFPIPAKVEFIGSQIEEIHKRITTGNDRMTDLTKDVKKHSQEALDMVLKICGQKK
jgi:hypothetical protein